MRDGWRWSVAAIVLVAGLGSGCGLVPFVIRGTTPSIERARSLIPPEGKALVFIVRLSGDGGRIPVACDGVELGTTRGKRFIYAMLEPGTHLFANRAAGNSELPIVLEAGKTYYFEQRPVQSFVQLQSRLVRLEDAEGQARLQKCSLSVETAAEQAR